MCQSGGGHLCWLRPSVPPHKSQGHLILQTWLSPGSHHTACFLVTTTFQAALPHLLLILQALTCAYFHGEAFAAPTPRCKCLS